MLNFVSYLGGLIFGFVFLIVAFMIVLGSMIRFIDWLERKIHK